MKSSSRWSKGPLTPAFAAVAFAAVAVIDLTEKRHDVFLGVVFIVLAVLNAVMAVRRLGSGAGS